MAKKSRNLGCVYVCVCVCMCKMQKIIFNCWNLALGTFVFIMILERTFIDTKYLFQVMS